MKKTTLIAVWCIALCSLFGTAGAQTTSLIHYWNFNSFATVYHNPNIPALTADYSAIDTSKAKLVYVRTATNTAYAGYIDTVAGDTMNARLSAPAGRCLRVRNPSDSMELRLYIPSTNYKNLTLKYEVESSSVGSGQKAQNFDYSIDSGLTWRTTGLNMTVDSITQAQFQGSSWGLITINFGTDSTVNNNPKLVFRIKFGGNTALTSGNNRIDNITLDGIYTPPPTLSLVHYWNFNNFASVYHNPNIPALAADYSVLDTSKAKMVYVLTAKNTAYAGYIDTVAGDTMNSRRSAPAGRSLRVRNPSDSMELRFYIPTTNYSNISLKYEVESSSVGSGQRAQNFDYSIDSGATWRTTGLNMTVDSINQPQFQGSSWGLISINFGADSSVNNNPELVFRIKFGGNTALTSGNNRIDNFTVDGAYYVPPPPVNRSLVHYWSFNSFASVFHNPGIPALTAEYSAIDTSKAKIVYLLTAKNQSYAGYIDTVAGDTMNSRLGAPAGRSLRVRNPSDSMELRFYIPSTNYSNLVLKYEVESSSVGSGQKAQLFDYSVDSGATWKTTGLNMTVDSITQSQFQGSSWGLISINFGTDTTVNNNPRLVFRVKFGGNTTLTSGNNRIDNVTLEGVYTAPPLPPLPVITINNPRQGDTLTFGQQEVISFSVTSTVQPFRVIQYSTDGGYTWTNIGTVISQNSINWTVPNIVTNNGRIQVWDFKGVTGYSGTFAIKDSAHIAPPPPPPGTPVLIHYWNFNNLTVAYHNPGIPSLAADYSLLDTSKARMAYVLEPGTSSSYAGYIDNVASTADSNLRMGAVAGQALRIRNPSDSMELRFYIPTTGYKNIALTYELESSSTTSGQLTDVFDYSTDSGATWKNTGLSKDSIDVTQTQYQGTLWGLVSLNFGADSSVNNNPRLVFRVKFKGNTSLTSGNNRFDDFTVDGVPMAPTTGPTSLVHYWNFNSLTTAYHNPGIPALTADYSAIDTSKAKMAYVLEPGTASSYAGYIDNVASAADSNLRMAAVAGQALRIRNPSDSMELRFYIPSTNYSHLALTYELESSSATSGQLTEVFDYSTDSGATWKTTGLNIDSLDVTQAQYQGALWGLVKLNFGTDVTVNNNPRLIFRIKFRGNTSMTSGNNRIDDFTVDGVYALPITAKINVLSPIAGDTLLAGESDTVTFAVTGNVTASRFIDFSSDSGKTWASAGSVLSGTSFAWSVPSTATTSGMIRVRDANNIIGTSGIFTILVPGTISKITVGTTPGQVVAGSQANIVWSASGYLGKTVSFDVSYDGQKTWTPIYDSYYFFSSSSYTWNVPASADTGVVVRVTFASGATGKSAPFSIVIPESVSGIPSLNGVSVWPNPSSGKLTCSYDLQNNQSVSLKLFDALGREVAYVTHGIEQAGLHAITIDASSLSPGTYMYALTRGSTISRGKMAIVR
jgi:hypothetical protein